MNETRLKTERALWEDYLFITQEMVKCLTRDDFPLFEELLTQRAKLQLMIESVQEQPEVDTGFSTEQAKMELGAQIKAADGKVQTAWRLYANARRNHSVAAMAYEGLDNPLRGMRMDKQR